jgi:hypothetical protein
MGVASRPLTKEFRMRREVLATVIALATLVAASLPAAAGCGGYYTAQSDQSASQQTAQVQTESKTATQ